MYYLILFVFTFVIAFILGIVFESNSWSNQIKFKTPRFYKGRFYVVLLESDFMENYKRKDKQ